MILNPIGRMVSKQIEPYQASRQPDENSLPGEIHLNSGQQFEQALSDLESCTHLWIIYHFHQNENWKPMVTTPRALKKIGVFATRAPYRPNPIGMTVVKLIKIEGLKIFVGPNDILNDTPILDIKPYHPESDVITDAHIGWLEDSPLQKYQIQFSPVAESDIDYLESKGLLELKPFILRQLEYDPTNHQKKRIEDHQSFWSLLYRTWRVDFIITEQQVSVLGIRSGYTQKELDQTNTEYADPYQDKNLHTQFNKRS